MFAPDYLRSREAWRARLPVLVAFVLLFAAVTPVLAQSDAEPTSPPLETLDSPLWAVALQPTALRSQPDDGSEQFTMLRPNAPLQNPGVRGRLGVRLQPAVQRNGLRAQRPARSG